MSSANPVDPKAEAAKPAAAALAETSASSPATKRPWSRLGLKQKFWILLLGAGVATAAVAYGYKYFNARPGNAVAQTDSGPPVSTPAPKPTDPAKPPPLISPDELPNVVVPPVTRVKHEDSTSNASDIKGPSDIKPPSDVRPAKPMPDDDGDYDDDPPPGKPLPLIKPETRKDPAPPLLLPNFPARTPDTAKTDEPPPIPEPPRPEPDSRDTKKDKPAEDIFTAPEPVRTIEKKGKAADLGPAPIPSEITEKSERTDPILRIGGTDTSPPPAPTPKKKDNPPASPNLDLDLPGLPAVPTPDKKDNGEAPAVVAPPNKERGGPLPVIKVPMLEETPPPPTITNPMIPDTPTTVKPGEKKENYLEDWHTFRNGDTSVSICQEYYHDAKYARALEAYNKDRRKAADGVVFVPPTYVLEDQFPNLIEKNDRSGRPEVRTTGNVTFEPAAPRPGAARPAPPPAIATSDEYRVTAEGGETIRDIARKVYGDENAWRKIFDMNREIDPTKPIPNGTALRLGR